MYDNNFYLTTNFLKSQLSKISEDLPVLVQRIEDYYFDKGGWTPVKAMDDSHLRDYILAFTAHRSYDDNDKNVFVINSHY
jgi:hypothetical protein